MLCYTKLYCTELPYTVFDAARARAPEEGHRTARRSRRLKIDIAITITITITLHDILYFATLYYAILKSPPPRSSQQMPEPTPKQIQHNSGAESRHI